MIREELQVPQGEIVMQIHTHFLPCVLTEALVTHQSSPGCAARPCMPFSRLPSLHIATQDWKVFVEDFS